MREFNIEENLELKVFQENHIEELAELVKQNLPHLGPWMIWAIGGYDVEHAGSFIRQNLKDISEGKIPTFGIFYHGKISGCIGFVKIDRENKAAEIGYWISAEHEGKGLITKCCRALIEYSFNELDMRQVEIRSAASNLRSRAVPERLGFKLEGQYVGEHRLPGGNDDLVIYLMTHQIWDTNRDSR
jgi:ribosomal-protein-serine acetyltransferase